MTRGPGSAVPGRRCIRRCGGASGNRKARRAGWLPKRWWRAVVGHERHPSSLRALPRVAAGQAPRSLRASTDCMSRRPSTIKWITTRLPMTRAVSGIRPEHGVEAKNPTRGCSQPGSPHTRMRPNGHLRVVQPPAHGVCCRLLPLPGLVRAFEMPIRHETAVCQGGVARADLGAQADGEARVLAHLFGRGVGRAARQQIERESVAQSCITRCGPTPLRRRGRRRR